MATVPVPRLKPRDLAARAVQTSLETGLSRIQGIEAEARRGDPEGIHRLRTSTRRLRSELRAFRGLADPAWIGPLEGEMKWLAGLLGDVRDLDVLTARFHKAADDEGLDTQELAPLFDDLTARHARALRELRNALQGDRYRGLIEALQQAIEHPTLNDEACMPCRIGVAAARRRGLAPAQEVRPGAPAVRPRRGLPRGPQAGQAGPLYGRDGGADPARGRRQGARRFIRGATRIQDMLGEHQDAIVAGDELTRLLDRETGDPCFTQAARLLRDRQAEAAHAARDAFFDAWDKLDRRKTRRWLKAGAGR